MSLSQPQHSWRELMDSMYEEDPWWEEDAKHPRINATHWDKGSVGPSSSTSERRSEPKPSLTRTLSSKFVPGQIVKEMTGRKRLTKQILEELLDESRHEELTRNYLFDPKVWLEVFRAATTKAQRDKLRLVVLAGTRAAAVEEQYWVVPGRDVANAKKVALLTHAHTLEYASMFDYAKEKDPAKALRESRFTSTAHFIYADVVDVGVFMKLEQKCDPLVLVFAHPTALGGTVNGGTSQEESVLRRTNLMNIVNNESQKDIKRDWNYVLPSYGGLYIPSAFVFRSNESTGYKYLVSPIKLSFLLAGAPLNMPRDKPNLAAKFVTDWKRKVDSVLAVALQKGHDSLVLGAWGCGEMGNDPKQVARLFQEALTSRFRGCFKHVVFSFLHDPQAFRAFCEVFGSPRMPVPEEPEVIVRSAVSGGGARSTAAEKKPFSRRLSPDKVTLEAKMDPRFPNISQELFPAFAPPPAKPAVFGRRRDTSSDPDVKVDTLSDHGAAGKRSGGATPPSSSASGGAAVKRSSPVMDKSVDSESNISINITVNVRNNSNNAVNNKNNSSDSLSSDGASVHVIVNNANGNNGNANNNKNNSGSAANNNARAGDDRSGVNDFSLAEDNSSIDESSEEEIMVWGPGQ